MVSFKESIVAYTFFSFTLLQAVSTLHCGFLLNPPGKKHPGHLSGSKIFKRLKKMLPACKDKNKTKKKKNLQCSQRSYFSSYDQQSEFKRRSGKLEQTGRQRFSSKEEGTF